MERLGTRWPLTRTQCHASTNHSTEEVTWANWYLQFPPPQNATACASSISTLRLYFHENIHNVGVCSPCFLNVFSSTDSKHTQFWFSTNTLMTWKRKEMRLGANNTPLTPRLPEHSEGSHLHPHAHCSDQCDVCYANHLICTTRHSSKGEKQSIKSLAPKSMRENKKQKQTGKVEKN